MVLTKHIKGSQYNRNKNQYSNGHSHAEYFYIVCDSSLYSNVNIKLYFTVGYGSMCWRWWYSFGGGIVCFYSSDIHHREKRQYRTSQQ